MLVAPAVRGPSHPDFGSQTAPATILVVQSCPVTPAGVVGQVAEARGANLRTVFPHRGDPLPEPADGLIVLGGPMHAGDDDGYPAFPAVLELIRRFHDEAKPVLGICLGAQLVARAFGGRVYPFGGMELGYLPLRLTAAGRRDPLLRGCAPEQRLMQFHEDNFDLPAGAVLLMTRAGCPNQAMRLGAATYGFQFHFEVTETDAPAFLEDCRDGIDKHFGATADAVCAAVRREIAEHYDAGAAFCRHVTHRWLDLVEARRQWARRPERRRRRA
jgi:GMP synthase-like glutamine amidotransferase